MGFFFKCHRRAAALCNPPSGGPSAMFDATRQSAAAWNFSEQVALGPESSSSIHTLESHQRTFLIAPERGSAGQASGDDSL